MNHSIDHFDALLRARGPSTSESAPSDELADLLCQRGVALCEHSRFQEAVSDFDRACAIYARPDHPGDPPHVAARLAQTLMHRGNARHDLGQRDGATRDYESAIPLFDKAVDHAERQFHDRRSNDSAHQLAHTLAQRGSALLDLGRAPDALADLNRSILIRNQACQEDDNQQSPALAASLNLRGLILASLQQLSQALRDYQGAVQIYARLVDDRGRDELSCEWARTLNNRANAFSAMSARVEGNRLDAAIADYDQAIRIYQRLLEQQDRPALRAELASLLDNRGVARRAQARPQLACKDYDRAIQIYEQLVDLQGHAALAPEYIACLLNRSYALHEQHKDVGRHVLDAAVRDLQKALALQTASAAAEPEQSSHLRELLTELETLRRDTGTSIGPSDTPSNP